MYIVIFCSFLALVLTFLESWGLLKHGMCLGFILLTTLGVIHYDYGNDYLPYMMIYDDVTSYPFNLEDLFLGSIFRDPGWGVLCYLFKPFGGFFMMVAVLNIFQNVIVYKIIRKYVERKWWLLSVFIYVCSTSLYILSFSMMRQSLIMYIFLGIWPLIEKRKWFLSACILLLCVTIHKSCLILIPFAFFGYLSFKNGKFLALSIFAIFSMMWLSKPLLNNLLGIFTSFEQFEGYLESYADADEKISFGIGYLLGLIPFALSLHYLSTKKVAVQGNNKLLVTFFVTSFLIVPFASIIPLLVRIGMYFDVYAMIAIPIIYKRIKNKFLLYMLLFIYIFLMLYSYISFFSSPVWIEKYTTFKTIFQEIL